ncbi:hypothetical protein MHBO_001975 [Bonamia ostreae]|uniref:ABC transporter domain-containing protein n=1 Tax=Bonamia ostreae TaxID=126728 RepID=A0ABV2ALC6_9EUKA
MESSNNSNKSEIEHSSNQIRLKFENINYSLKKGNKRQVLKNCSGVALPGRLLTIIGTSGAGKSSLMNILSGRLRTNRNVEVTGDIKLNGSSKYSSEAFKQNTAYVLQEDLVFETLSVAETFDLSATLRLPSDMSAERKKRRIESIISNLGLERCRNSMVGGKEIRGVSGGERKRVCIGNELIINPSLFFLDEPTSGLDSYTALKIVKLLVNLARTGRTIIVTLHQPSSEMFANFDDLLVMSAGRVVYNGSAQRSMAVFAKLGSQVPVNSNPSDHYLSVVQVEKDKDLEKIDYFADNYLGYLKEEIDNDEDGQRKSLLEKPLTAEKIKKPGLMAQIYYLTIKRAVKNYIRTPSLTYLRAITTLFFSIICGILFYKLEFDQAGTNARLGSIFFILVNLLLNSVLNVVLQFPLEKKVVLNEVSNGMYTILPYFISKFLVELPINIIVALVYQLIVYFMIGFENTVKQFFIMFLVLILWMQIGYFIGMLIGVVAPTSELAVPLVSLTFTPAMLFSGFFINASQIKIWLRWATFVNYFRYILDMLFYNELNNNIRKYKVCILNECRFLTGKEVLSTIDRDDIKFWLWFGIGVIFMLFFAIITYVILLFKTNVNFGKPLYYHKSSIPTEEKKEEV